MPNGIPYICNLIQKNPMIQTLDLSNTQLNDKEAELLVNALKSNTRLHHLNLEGNDISYDKLHIIEHMLADNRSQAVLEKQKKDVFSGPVNKSRPSGYCKM